MNNINMIEQFPKVDYVFSDLESYSLGNILNFDNLLEGQKSSIQDIDLVLFKIKKVTFDEKAPRKEAVENILNSLRFINLNLLYIIKGDSTGSSIYMGLSRNSLYKLDGNISVADYGERILKRTIEGNYRGCLLEKLNITKEEKEKNKKNEELDDFLRSLYSCNKYRQIEGIPGESSIGNSSVSYQGVDRLIDTMMGDDYFVVITAREMDARGVKNIETTIYDSCDILSPLSKMSYQKGENESKTISRNEGSSESKAKSTNWGVQISTQTKGDESGSSVDYTKSPTGNDSNTRSVNIGTSSSLANGNSENRSHEVTNKANSAWLKYLDDILLKRVDYGKGKGIFLVSTMLYAKEEIVIKKLENTFISIFSGESGNKSPLKSFVPAWIDVARGFQIPIIKMGEPSYIEICKRICFGQYISQKGNLFMGNWMSAKELSVITNFPQKEVNGIEVTKEIEYGLNYHFSGSNEKKLFLGNLVQSGLVLDKINIDINKDDLDKHIFVTGVTGSGKTTTCMRLLEGSNRNFLVIEPAKTEYRILAKDKKNSIKEEDKVFVYTLGNDSVAPFRLNPLQFVKGEPLSSHVDMVKACIQAASVMEAAIPQIMESALYKCYEEKGWDKYSSENLIYEDPFGKDADKAFPMLSDFKRMCESVVKEQKFDKKLESDYIGSINARLLGLIEGTKGQMLNTPRSLDLNKLIKRKVVLELEDIKSGEEKAQIMGFILISVNEAIKQEFLRNKDEKETYNRQLREKTKRKEQLEDRKVSGNFSKGEISQLEDKIRFLDEKITQLEKNKEIGKKELSRLLEKSSELKLDKTPSIEKEKELERVEFKCKELQKQLKHIESELKLEKKENISNKEKHKELQRELEKLIKQINSLKIKLDSIADFKHITLVEEAHRLLSKVGDSNGSQKNAVDMFTNMLAEVRKYGEGMIIADQIPNKLAPEVLKNTNTKIVHKIFAQDDKDAIGNTMALTQEQKDFLSSLPSGRAIIYAPGFQKSIQTQIKLYKDTTEEYMTFEEIEEYITNRVFSDYFNSSDYGIFTIDKEIQKNLSIDEFKYLVVKQNMIFTSMKCLSSMFFIANSENWEKNQPRFNNFYNKDLVNKLGVDKAKFFLNETFFKHSTLETMALLENILKLAGEKQLDSKALITIKHELAKEVKEEFK